MPSLLIYGPLRSGKTAFLGQMGSRGLFLDFDRGYRTLEMFQDKWTKDRRDTEIFSYFDTDWTKPKAYQGAMKKVKELLAPNAKPWDVVGLDSFTGLFQSIIAFVLFNSGHAGRSPTQPEWGVILNEIENFMRLFKGIPAIKIVTGHEYILTTDDNSTRIKLLCPGRKMPNQILGFFDDVFYTKLRKKAGGEYEYTLTSQATNAIECGTRSGFKEDYSLDEGLWNFLERLGYGKA